ncbi:MAG: hypothetical protein GC136_00600 [Alphaproteobacteria bacterium]|nr:hypothetical protein [Alphaproteobacteria bacterium]
MNSGIFLITILVFTAVMLGLAWFARRGADADTFFAAGRRVSAGRTAFATAIGWMWADIFFSTSQIGYDYGIYGLVWFSIATFLGFFLFAFIAMRVKKDAPDVVTIPDFVALKSDHSAKAHIVMTIAVMLYQLVVLGLNATISGFLLHAAFGFDYLLSAASIVVLVLTYSLINGLKTSTYTGILQFFIVMALMTGLMIVLYKGVDTTALRFFGAENALNSPFNTHLVLSLGIPISIIVLTQPLVDQMIFQRLVALKKPARIVKAFTLTGIFCATILLISGSLGFLGLSLAQQGLIEVTDTQLAIVQTVEHYLGQTGLLLFVIAFFAVIFSTVDAGYCSLSALIGYDIYKKYIKPAATERDIINVGRLSMAGAAFIGVLFSLAQFKILWMLFIIGAIGGAIVAPIVFAMLRPCISGTFVAASVIVSLILTLPLSVYGNMNGDALLVSGASIGSIVIGALICGLGLLRK